MKNRKRWSVLFDGISFTVVRHRPSLKSWRLAPGAFVFGQRSFDAVTDQFPNYIHHEVWRLFAASVA